MVVRMEKLASGWLYPPSVAPQHSAGQLPHSQQLVFSRFSAGPKSALRMFKHRSCLEISSTELAPKEFIWVHTVYNLHVFLHICIHYHTFILYDSTSWLLLGARVARKLYRLANLLRRHIFQVSTVLDTGKFVWFQGVSGGELTMGLEKWSNFFIPMAIWGADVDEEGSHDERQAISEGFHGGPNGEESHQKGRQGQGDTEDVGRHFASWKLPMLISLFFLSLPKIMADVISVDFYNRTRPNYIRWFRRLRYFQILESIQWFGDVPCRWTFWGTSARTDMAMSMVWAELPATRLGMWIHRLEGGHVMSRWPVSAQVPTGPLTGKMRLQRYGSRST